MEIIKNISGQITNYWTELSKQKKISFIILMALILIISITVVVLLNKTDYAVLYTGLSENEAGEIYSKLSEGGTSVKAKGNGTIMVPVQEEEHLRMGLAAEGYPKTALNYDVFKNSTGFGTTEYEKQKYMQFQLQDRLQETIKSIDLVEDAIVTLTLPDNNSVVLKEDKKPSTASVFLKVRNNTRLSSQQVNAISELISKSVPGLTPENISIIDNNMQVLNGSNNSEMGHAGNLLELEKQVGADFENQILNLLEPVFGYGKVVAGVNVRLDFDKVTTETLKYEPIMDEEGIAISLTQLEEKTKNSSSGGQPGQDANGGAPVYVSGNDDENVYEKVSKTVNYEVNQTRELIEKAQGEIDELTVSVVLDQEEEDILVVEHVKQVVAGAIGVNADSVIVKAMKFNGVDALNDAFNAIPGKENLKDKQRNTFIYILTGILLMLLTVIVLKFVGGKSSAPDYISEEEEDSGEIPQVINGVMPIDSKESHKERIESFYKNNKEVVVQLIRSRLNED